MRHRLTTLLLFTAIIVFASGHLYAAVPTTISYQGRLTNAVGAPITGAANLLFTICADSLCTQQLWTETQSGIIISKGLFDVRLGSANPIPPSVFNGSLRWLSISVEGQAGNRRMPLQSVPYSFRSVIADTAEYAKNSATSGCNGCDDQFVNTTGPDSVHSSSGSAFLGKVEGSTASELRGVAGYASNSSNGHAYGGSFSTSSEGTGIHYGLKADGYGAATVNTYGVLGTASNTSSGNTYGGRFTVNNIGTGTHYALSTNATSSSTSPSYGIDATAYNTSSGEAHGGRFSALTNGTGVHYALSADAAGSSSSAVYGLNSTASNSSSGAAYGAALTVEAGGTGTHYGAYIHSDGAGSGGAFGVWSEAENTSSGSAYGGYFRTTTSGTGKHYGISGNANGNSDAEAYACYGYSTNASTGDSYGGYFITGTSGTGVHYGVKANASGGSSSAVHGIHSEAKNTSTGAAYGGTFTVPSDGDGAHYGVYSQSTGSSAQSAYAVYGTAGNTGSGRTYGGYFAAGNSGTGEHTGVSAEAYNDDNHDCFGMYGYANNTYQGGWGQGNSFGGYFVGQVAGGGKAIGIYAEATPRDPFLDLARENLAGFFAGPVEVSRDLWVMGTIHEYGKANDGKYHATYSQQSPESWVEDFGEGQLTNGIAHIELDPLFLQMVTIDKDQPFKVFIQLNDEECNGTAVRRGSTGFDVIELQNGTSNAAFSYRVVAKRRGYEDKRLDVLTGPTPEEMKAESEAIKAKYDADRVERQAEEQRLRDEQAAAKAKEDASQHEDQ